VLQRKQRFEKEFAKLDSRIQAETGGNTNGGAIDTGRLKTLADHIKEFTNVSIILCL
jgi:hypothetical protein